MNLKKLTGLLAAGFLVMGVKLAHAATTNYNSIAIQVSIGSADELAIALSDDGGSTWDTDGTQVDGTTPTVTIAGIVPLGGSTVTATGVIIRNDSPNINVRYGLRSFDSTPWTFGDVATENVFTFYAQFNTNYTDAQPTVGSYVAEDNIFSADLPVCAGGATDPGLGTTCEFPDDDYDEFVFATTTALAGTGSAENVPYLGLRTVWLRLDAPTSTSVAGVGSREMTVGVIADLP
jgi:hypothetical protein